MNWKPLHPTEDFGPRQYLVTPPIKRTKPRVILKPLLASTSASKETGSNLEDSRRVELMGRGDTKGLVKADVGLINHFVSLPTWMWKYRREPCLPHGKPLLLYLLMNGMMKGNQMWSKWPQFKAI